MHTAGSLQQEQGIDDDDDDDRPAEQAPDFTTEATITNTFTLLTGEELRQRALWIMRFAVFADAAANLVILGPNVPMMVFPEAHEEAFDDTGPFGTVTAQHFISMCCNLGAAFGAMLFGRLSDRYGRRGPVILCLAMSVVWNVVRFLLRTSWWGFNVAGFVNGFFAGVPAIGLAYVSDLFPTNRQRKDAEVTLITGFWLIGMSAGGVACILLSRWGLFVPLWAGAVLNFVAMVVSVFYLLEPDDIVQEVERDEQQGVRRLEAEEKGQTQGSIEEGLRSTGLTRIEEHDETVKNLNKNEVAYKPPETLDRPVFWNIIAGSLTDAFGSTGLMPMALTPLLFDTFHKNLLIEGQDPLLAENGYKWVYTLMGAVAMPSAIISPLLYRKVGTVGACIFANIATGGVITALLYTAVAAEPTTATLVSFILILYLAYPFTVISSVTTGPMMDRICPENMRGEVQGMNVFSFQVTTAVSPFLMGWVVDEYGTQAGFLTLVAVSAVAALVNTPLLFHPLLQRIPGSEKTETSIFEESMFSALFEAAEAARRTQLPPPSRDHRRHTWTAQETLSRRPNAVHRASWVPSSSTEALSRRRTSRRDSLSRGAASLGMTFRM